MVRDIQIRLKIQSEMFESSLLKTEFSILLVSQSLRLTFQLFVLWEKDASVQIILPLVFHILQDFKHMLFWTV